MQNRTERIGFMVTKEEKGLLIYLAEQKGHSFAVVLRDLIRSAYKHMQQENKSEQQATSTSD